MFTWRYGLYSILSIQWSFPPPEWCPQRRATAILSVLVLSGDVELGVCAYLPSLPAVEAIGGIIGHDDGSERVGYLFGKVGK